MGFGPIGKSHPNSTHDHYTENVELTLGRKLVIGRREIQNSLQKGSRKLSRDHVEILPRIIDGIAKVSIKPVGKNPLFTAKFEYPMVPVLTGTSAELFANDLIGFRLDDFVFQIIYSSKKT